MTFRTVRIQTTAYCYKVELLSVAAHEYSEMREWILKNNIPCTVIQNSIYLNEDALISFALRWR